MRSRKLALAFTALLALPSLVGCGGDDSGTGGSTGTTTGTSGTGGEGGRGGSGPGGHLLISEIALAPGTAEFVEIWNPTSAEVDLSDHYISDNSAYFRIATGMPWMPNGTPGLDFLLRFPPGTVIAPDGVLVLTSTPGYESTFMRCADFSLLLDPVPCGAGTIKPMVEPPNGGVGTQAGGLLSNEAEMVVLFTWDGVVGSLVKDVDYVTWGAGAGNSERADKTAEPGYAPDTARPMQSLAPTPAEGQSMERCGDELEPGEIHEGGNGVSGHDETSEALDKSFATTSMRSPGVKNGCLPAL